MRYLQNIAFLIGILGAAPAVLAVPGAENSGVDFAQPNDAIPKPPVTTIRTVKRIVVTKRAAAIAEPVKTTKKKTAKPPKTDKPTKKTTAKPTKKTAEPRVMARAPQNPHPPKPIPPKPTKKTTKKTAKPRAMKRTAANAMPTALGSEE